MQGRLPEGFRERVKRYAAGVIRTFVALPKGRQEVNVIANQLLRSGTSVAAHSAREIIAWFTFMSLRSTQDEKVSEESISQAKAREIPS